MKDFFKSAGVIKRRIANGGSLVFLFDFDGVLSPIVLRPDKASLPARTRRLLSALSRNFFVAVVSGRELADVARRVNLPGLIYSGSHGMELRLSSRNRVWRPPVATARALRRALPKLQELAKKYPGAFVEKKKFSLVLHYRMASKTNQARLKRQFLAFVPVLAKSGLEANSGKKIFELKPKNFRHKGMACLDILASLRRFHKQLLPVYFGDDFTDEDAFRSLPNGINIHVGRSRTSAAAFFLESQSKVYQAVNFLCACAMAQKSRKFAAGKNPAGS